MRVGIGLGEGEALLSGVVFSKSTERPSGICEDARSREPVGSAGPVFVFEASEEGQDFELSFAERVGPWREPELFCES